MRPTEKFRAHHDDLLAMAGQIASGLDVASLQKDARGVRAQLSKLAGLLNVHLTMEDRTLYPKLEAHPSPAVAATAARFMREMGGLKAAFLAYANRWGARQIEEAPAAFVDETGAIFAALADRIARENDELYALLDQAA
jgi:hypothetical protein